MSEIGTPPPVFTIGPRDEYVTSLAEVRQAGQVLLKFGMEMAGHQGKAPEYTGGIVFQNPRDGRRYIDEEWPEETRPKMAVFEVKASWEHDCYSIDDEVYWRYLTYNRPISLLVTEDDNGSKHKETPNAK